MCMFITKSLSKLNKHNCIHLTYTMSNQLMLMPAFYNRIKVIKKTSALKVIRQATQDVSLRNKCKKIQLNGTRTRVAHKVCLDLNYKLDCFVLVQLFNMPTRKNYY